MVRDVKRVTKDWEYDLVSIGYPGAVIHGRPRHVADVVERLKDALGAEYVVLGGGNAKNITKLPPGTQLGDNRNAFVGGFRLWKSKTGHKEEAAAKKGNA